MPFFDFVWTPEREEHFAQHGVTPEEFEEVVTDPDGITVLPITAFEVEP